MIAYKRSITLNKRVWSLREATRCVTDFILILQMICEYFILSLFVKLIRKKGRKEAKDEKRVSSNITYFSNFPPSFEASFAKVVEKFIFPI